MTVISVATYASIAQFQPVSFELFRTFGEYLLLIFRFILLLSTLTPCFRVHFVLHRGLISSRCITQRLPVPPFNIFLYSSLIYSVNLAAKRAFTFRFQYENCCFTFKVYIIRVITIRVFYRPVFEHYAFGTILYCGMSFYCF